MRILFSVALLALGCGSGGSGSSNSGAGGSLGAGGSAGGSTGVGGSSAGNAGTGGSESAGGSGATGGSGASGGSAPLPEAMGTPGVWENVTSSEMDPGLFTGSGGFGIGNIVQDPNRPTDMYAGGYGSIWKSTDYGLTWEEIPSNPVPPSQPLGHVLEVGGDGEMWMANVYGDQKVFRSTDAGLTFTLTGTLVGGGDAALYSIEVDPNDSTHLISGFHEQDGMAESTDSGETWTRSGETGWPDGGVSWFPFFIDMGNAAETSKTWLAIAQNGASVIRTTDAGATWTIPDGISGLQHPHGNAGIYQDGATIFTGGSGGPGDGIYKSTDYGLSWTKVDDHAVSLVFGSSKNLYGMWGWACASCTWDNPVQSRTAPQPGTTWSDATAEATNGLDWGPNSVATTSDGTHAVFVGAMWTSGLWRYIEP
jgi:hypothetical protein